MAQKCKIEGKFIDFCMRSISFNCCVLVTCLLTTYISILNFITDAVLTFYFLLYIQGFGVGSKYLFGNIFYETMICYFYCLYL